MERRDDDDCVVRVCGGSCFANIFLFSSVFRRSYGFIPLPATTIARVGVEQCLVLLYLLVLGSLMVGFTPLNVVY